MTDKRIVHNISWEPFETETTGQYVAMYIVLVGWKRQRCERSGMKTFFLILRTHTHNYNGLI